MNTAVKAPTAIYHRAPIFTLWMAILGGMMITGLLSGGLVFVKGLEVTNLTNQVPWGLWITVDLSAIALGAGAFSLSAIAYVFRVKSFRQIARLAVFVGLVGYTSAMLALLLDIGRPDRFWYPSVYWNIHSVLWEITIAVMLYFSVLVIEFLPILLESRLVTKRFPRAAHMGHWLHHLTPIMAVIGLGISILHQSSLGATYGVLAARPIWFKPSMPIMFITSAVAAGAAFTLMLTVVYENLVGKRQIDPKLRRGVAIFAGLMMLAYLYIKLWDYLATGYYSQLPARIESLSVLERMTPYTGTFWLIEVGLGALIPAVLLLTPRLRNQDIWVVLAGILVVLGIIVNRWNVTLSGLIVPMDWSPGVIDLLPVNAYQPSPVEWGAGIGILGYALMMFTLGLRYLPMFPEQQAIPDTERLNANMPENR